MGAMSTVIQKGEERESCVLVMQNQGLWCQKKQAGVLGVGEKQSTVSSTN